LSGLADVDAVTLSFARMSGERLAIEGAALAVLIAVTSNTVSKTAMAAWVGGRAFGILVGLVNTAAIAAMFVGYWMLPSAAGIFGTFG
jgi:uncharacterized membrane protein (DUF4010 family)